MEKINYQKLSEEIFLLFKLLRYFMRKSKINDYKNPYYSEAINMMFDCGELPEQNFEEFEYFDRDEWKD